MSKHQIEKRQDDPHLLVGTAIGDSVVNTFKAACYPDGRRTLCEDPRVIESALGKISRLDTTPPAILGTLIEIAIQNWERFPKREDREIWEYNTSHALELLRDFPLPEVIDLMAKKLRWGSPSEIFELMDAMSFLLDTTEGKINHSSFLLISNTVLDEDKLPSGNSDAEMSRIAYDDILRVILKNPDRIQHDRVLPSETLQLRIMIDDKVNATNPMPRLAN